MLCNSISSQKKSNALWTDLRRTENFASRNLSTAARRSSPCSWTASVLKYSVGTQRHKQWNRWATIIYTYKASSSPSRPALTQRILWNASNANNFSNEGKDRWVSSMISMEKTNASADAYMFNPSL